MEFERDLLGKIREIDAGRYCDSCLGRIVGPPRQTGSNRVLGEKIRQALAMERATGPGDCELCQGLLDEIDNFVRLVEKKMEGHEYSSFLLGTKFDRDLLDKEADLQSRIGDRDQESIKAEMNREVGKILEKKSGIEVDFKAPDIVAVIDTRFDKVDLQIKSLYLGGRYKKLERGIPQTRWPCRACRGRGCKRCNNTGKMYPTSVEEIVAGVPMAVFKGTDHAFHGMGREDIDALMLGNGRPFVLEIREPVKRKADPVKIQETLNDQAGGKVEVTDLHFVDGAEVVKYKDSRNDKTYRARVQLTGPVSDHKFQELATQFTRKIIKQKTPIRVSHRRADKVREREIRYLKILDRAPGDMQIEVKSESGTYIKELISGDEGRTVPSVAAFLGVECKVVALDVVWIHDQEGAGDG
jgi:tRNA pseudouridine synthase 10